MSTKKPLILLLFLTALIYSCSENESEIKNDQPEKITFSFSLSTQDVTGGRVAANEFPAGSSLLISLTDNVGNPVLTHHSINIIQFGGSYITEPLELAPGRYNVTDFMVVGDSSDVLFATPHRNAPLSKIVNHPLPYSFGVSRNKLVNVEMEVVDAHQHAPEDFGYASFNVTVVTPLSISVFTSNNTGLKLTDAKAYILKGTDTLSTYNLGAKVNALVFKHNDDDTCTLVIIKDGYARYTKNFVRNELNNKPLTVYLAPALTLNLRNRNFEDLEFLLEILLRGPGEFIVNWGDGTEELIQTSPYYDPYYDDVKAAYFEHTFPTRSNYFVSITGPLDKITGFYPPNLNHAFNPLNVSALPSLKDFGDGNSRNGLLDLRQNEKLEDLQLGGTYESILLPDNHNIRFVDLHPNMAGSVDYFIDNVYKNAKAKGIYEGTFDFSDYAYQPTEGEIYDPIIEPSESSKLKLKELSFYYRWKIYPITYRFQF